MKRVKAVRVNNLNRAADAAGTSQQASTKTKIMKTLTKLALATSRSSRSEAGPKQADRMVANAAVSLASVPSRRGTR
jgi:hypothetical protein